MPDPTPTTPTAPTPDWFAALDAEAQAHIGSKGWNKPAAEVIADIYRSQRAAEKMIGAPVDQVLRLPKDANDPTFAGVYERLARMRAPADPSGYTFDNVRYTDGSALGDADAAALRELAVKKGWSAQETSDVAAWTVQRDEAMRATGNSATETAKAANAAALRMAWGTDHDQKAFAVHRLAQEGGLPPEVLDYVRTLPAEKMVAAMNFFAGAGATLTEATLLRGGRTPQDPTNGMTPEQARARFDDLKQNPDWAQKALRAGTPESELYRNLVRVMTGPPR